MSAPPDRQQLLEEFKAWNELLSNIHEAELEALIADDLPAFQELQSMAQKAHKAREIIAGAIQATRLR